MVYFHIVGNSAEGFGVELQPVGYRRQGFCRHRSQAAFVVVEIQQQGREP